MQSTAQFQFCNNKNVLVVTKVVISLLRLGIMATCQQVKSWCPEESVGILKLSQISRFDSRSVPKLVLVAGIGELIMKIP